MKIQKGTQVPTGAACQNLTQRYLFTLAPASADLVLLIAIEVLLIWS